MKKLLAAALVVLTLSACSAPSPEPAAAPATEAPEVVQAEDAASPFEAYCSTLSEVLIPYQEILTALVDNEKLDSEKWLSVSDGIESLDTSELSAGWKDDHDGFVSVYLQIKEALAGDGNLQMETTDYKLGVIGLLERCTDAGFKAD